MKDQEKYFILSTYYPLLGQDKMLNDIVQEFTQRMESRMLEIVAEFTQQLNFADLEAALNAELAKLNANFQQAVLQKLLLNYAFINMLKKYAGTLGMRLKEYRCITLTLSNGQQIKIDSPYFIKAKPHKWRKKRGPNGSGRHMALEILGFIGRVSPGLLLEAVQTALLCPSYDVASTVLKGRGINLDVKALRRLCRLAGEVGVGLRGSVSLSGEENLQGHTLVISIDGGRLRERRRKRGRKAKDSKRQGYHADWKEPKLFTIYLTNEKGEIVKKFQPLQDATMENHEGMFALLESYLRNLEIEDAARIVFCGDGSAWIWHGVEALCKRMNFDKPSIYQVLDHTHAKQNLGEIVELLNSTKQAKARKKWEALLWNGDFDALKNSIKETITGKDNRKQALNKFANYFTGNQERMRYSWFKTQDLPCGSGHVESAIRRVINLRLKAPGTFWLREMAEYFLFLRSQLLSGRWEIFMTNLTALTRRAFWPFYAADGSESESLEVQ